MFQDGVNDVRGYVTLGFERKLLCSVFPADDFNLIGIPPKSRSWVIERIQYNEIKILGDEFFLCVAALIFSLKRKAHDDLFIGLLLAKLELELLNGWKGRENLFSAFSSEITQFYEIFQNL